MNTKLEEVKDEFGRDISLRIKKQQPNNNNPRRFPAYLSKYRNLSWAEMTILLEEEEEEREKKQIRERIIKEHRHLYLKGNYEVEEGEELEFL